MCTNSKVQSQTRVAYELMWYGLLEGAREAVREGRAAPGPAALEHMAARSLRLRLLGVCDRRGSGLLIRGGCGGWTAAIASANSPAGAGGRALKGAADTGPDECRVGRVERGSRGHSGGRSLLC